MQRRVCWRCRHKLSQNRCPSHVLFIFSPSFSLFLVGFFLRSSSVFVPVPLPHCHHPRQAWDPERPQNPFSTPRKGSQSTVRVGRPWAQPTLLPASWGVPEGWAPLTLGGAKVSEGGGWAGGAPEPVEEGGPDGPGGSRVLRWVPGQGVVAEGHRVPGGGCSPVTPPGMGTRGHGPGAHGLWQV